MDYFSELSARFADAADFTARELSVAGTACTLCFLDGLVSGSEIGELVIRPLEQLSGAAADKRLSQQIQHLGSLLVVVRTEITVLRRADLAACAEVWNEDCPHSICAHDFRAVRPRPVDRQHKWLMALRALRQNLDNRHSVAVGDLIEGPQDPCAV